MIFFISFDLTSAYHHVSILPAHRGYLGFAYHWPQGKVRHFCFNVLPFGLSSACHAFTKIVRPLVKHWRSAGIGSFVYIDDGIGVFHSESQAIIQSQLMRADLLESGFLVNNNKSRWSPSQSLDWLGFRFDSTTMLIRAGQAKVDKVIRSCSILLEATTVSPRQVAAITGQLIAMQRAIGPECRLMTRFLSFWVDDQLKFNEPLPIIGGGIFGGGIFEYRRWKLKCFGRIR